MSCSSLEWGPCALHHWIQSSMQAILACRPALSTKWLAGWQFPVCHDVCAQPHWVWACMIAEKKKQTVRHVFKFYQADSVLLRILQGTNKWPLCFEQSRRHCFHKSWNGTGKRLQNMNQSKHTGEVLKLEEKEFGAACFTQTFVLLKTAVYLHVTHIHHIIHPLTMVTFTYSNHLPTSAVCHHSVHPLTVIA